MNTIDVNQLLGEMRRLSNQVDQSVKPVPIESSEGQSVEFGELLKKSIESVNDTQMQAGKLSAAFEKGDPNVDLAQVMIALQKASVSFQAMTQVRNKLVQAYQDVMNMPV